MHKKSIKQRIHGGKYGGRIFFYPVDYESALIGQPNIW